MCGCRSKCCNISTSPPTEDLTSAKAEVELLMLARQVTTRASRALLARSLHPQGPVAYFSRQRGPYDDDAPAGDFRIGTVEVKPEAENAGFSTAHRFSVGAATMPLSPQNEAPSATGYAAQSAPTEETEAPVIPKHLQKESARPCADSLLVGTSAHPAVDEEVLDRASTYATKDERPFALFASPCSIVS